jgi:hypothetical protein
MDQLFNIKQAVPFFMITSMAPLMLQEYREGNPNIPATKGIGVAICFQCTDSLALYNLHFESPTDVPEETTYSEWVK